MPVSALDSYRPMHDQELRHARSLRFVRSDDLDAVVDEFCAFFTHDVEPHLAREEEMLLSHCPADAILRLWHDHERLRDAAERLADPKRRSVVETRALGIMLEEHVLWEERELRRLLGAA